MADGGGVSQGAITTDVSLFGLCLSVCLSVCLCVSLMIAVTVITVMPLDILFVIFFLPTTSVPISLPALLSDHSLTSSSCRPVLSCRSGPLATDGQLLRAPRC